MKSQGLVELFGGWLRLGNAEVNLFETRQRSRVTQQLRHHSPRYRLSTMFRGHVDAEDMSFVARLFAGLTVETSDPGQLAIHKSTDDKTSVAGMLPHSFRGLSDCHLAMFWRGLGESERLLLQRFEPQLPVGFRIGGVKHAALERGLLFAWGNHCCSLHTHGGTAAVGWPSQMSSDLRTASFVADSG